MNENINNKDDIKHLLMLPLLSPSKNNKSSEIRLVNILWIKDLDRNCLKYGSRERQLLIHETNAGEKIFIQYPGKESLGEGNRNRPWDFRPRVYIEKSLSWLDDMSFMDIWDIMNDNFKKIIDSNKIEVFKILAILFYRMAFMIDHLKLDDFDTQYIDLYIDEDIEKKAVDKDSLKLPSFYKYNPDEKILNHLENKCRTIWGGLSLEGFLYYNEILTWNEDCKYYYRSNIINKKKDWIGATGRVNTALTHILIISLLLGYVQFSRVCSGFSRGHGVAPISNKELKEYFIDYINFGELF